MCVAGVCNTARDISSNSLSCASNILWVREQDDHTAQQCLDKTILTLVSSIEWTQHWWSCVPAKTTQLRIWRTADRMSLVLALVKAGTSSHIRCRQASIQCHQTAANWAHSEPAVGFAVGRRLWTCCRTIRMSACRKAAKTALHA